MKTLLAILLVCSFVGCSKKKKSSPPPVESTTTDPVIGDPTSEGTLPPGQGSENTLSMANIDREAVISMINTLHKNDQFLYFCVRTYQSTRGDQISSGAIYSYRDTGRKLKLYKRVINQDYDEVIYKEVKKVRKSRSTRVHEQDFYLVQDDQRNVIAIEGSLVEEANKSIYLDIISDARGLNVRTECTNNI